MNITYIGSIDLDIHLTISQYLYHINECLHISEELITIHSLSVVHLRLCIEERLRHLYSTDQNQMIYTRENINDNEYSNLIMLIGQIISHIEVIITA